MLGEPNSLEQYFLVFAEAALAWAREWAAVEGLPRYHGEQVKFTDQGGTTVIVEDINWWGLFKAHYEELWTMNEANTCALAHWRAGVLKPGEISGEAGNPIPEPNWEQRRQQLIEDLLGPVIETVDRTRSLQPPAERLLERYGRWRDLRTGSVRPRFVVTVPLVNFTSEVRDAPIGPRLQLTRFEPWEKTFLWNPPLLSQGFISYHAFERATMKLTGSYEKQDPLAEQELVADAARAVTALRLLGPGEVGAPVYYQRMEEETVSGRSSTPFPDLRVQEFGPEYALREVDFPRLGKLFRALHGGADQKLRIALRRFNLSYSRQYSEDRIIDLTIALESSLLHGVRDELSYRLAMRGAAALADPRDPARTELLLRAMYYARSDIVHGDRDLQNLSNRVGKDLQSLKPSQKVHELPRLCEDLTRDVLSWFVLELSAGQSLKQITKRIDARITDGLRNPSG